MDIVFRFIKKLGIYFVVPIQNINIFGNSQVLNDNSLD